MEECSVGGAPPICHWASKSLFSLDIFQVAVTSPVSCVSGVTIGNGRCGH